jgi:hypothetical protein
MACHVALWWGPPVRWLVLGWGPLADMDQWEVVTWHSAAELAQSDAATWHTLSLPLFYTSFVLCTQFVPRTIVVPKLHPELSWSNLSPWLIHLICFIFSKFILIAPLIQKSWNFHQKSLNSWWSLLYFLIPFFPLPPWIKNLFSKETVFSSLN